MLQADEHDLFEVLKKRLDRLTHSILKEYFFPDFQYQDFKQESYRILFKAMKEYDKNYEVSFPVYYQMCLQNYLNNLVRMKHALKRKEDLYLTSLDHLKESFGEHMVGTSAAETQPEDAFLVRENLEEYLSSLSKHERECFRYHTFGLSHEKIANKLSCDVSKVKSALYRCRKKFLD